MAAGSSMSSQSPINVCRLPLDFTALDFAADLAAINTDAWVQHFNTGYHDGGWSGVALRAPDGDATRLTPDHSAAPNYADTPLLARCPTIQAVLRAFACPLESVRLLRLAPGGQIREHHDPGLKYENGVARLHVPLLTNDASEFYLDNARVVMARGTCWYLNFDLPHRVQNLGATDRIHLVIDAQVNDWLRGLINGAAAQCCEASPAPSSLDAFHHFRALVIDDAALTAQFWDIESSSAFVAAVIDAGHARGFAFTQADVEAAMRAGTRSAASHRMATSG